MLAPRARELGTAHRGHPPQPPHRLPGASTCCARCDDGMLLVLACSDPNAASVAPFGGTQAVFTPNPLALGFPLTGDGAVLVDISASITTNGMSNRKHEAGEHFAEAWLIDAQGRPSNDPSVLFAEPPGTLLPVGGLEPRPQGLRHGTAGRSADGGTGGTRTRRCTRRMGRHGPSHAVRPAGVRREGRLSAPDGPRSRAVQWQCAGGRVPPGPAARGAWLARRAEQLEHGVRLHASIAASLQEAEQRHGCGLPTRCGREPCQISAGSAEPADAFLDLLHIGGRETQPQGRHM